jgi:hypothetical protein
LGSGFDRRRPRLVHHRYDLSPSCPLQGELNKSSFAAAWTALTNPIDAILRELACWAGLSLSSRRWPINSPYYGCRVPSRSPIVSVTLDDGLRVNRLALGD